MKIVWTNEECQKLAQEAVAAGVGPSSRELVSVMRQAQDAHIVSARRRNLRTRQDLPQKLIDMIRALSTAEKNRIHTVVKEQVRNVKDAPNSPITEPEGLLQALRQTQLTNRAQLLDVYEELAHTRMEVRELRVELSRSATLVAMLAESLMGADAVKRLTGDEPEAEPVEVLPETTQARNTLLNVLVVGALPEQLTTISRGLDYDVILTGGKLTPTRTHIVAAKADIVVLMTRFISHAHQDGILKFFRGQRASQAKRLVYSNQGVSGTIEVINAAIKQFEA